MVRCRQAAELMRFQHLAVCREDDDREFVVGAKADPWRAVRYISSMARDGQLDFSDRSAVTEVIIGLSAAVNSLTAACWFNFVVRRWVIGQCRIATHWWRRTVRRQVIGDG